MFRLSRLPLVVIGAALFGSTVACEEKKTGTETSRSDAGPAADKYATADPKLEKALKAAAAASAGAEDGPPPQGVFAAGIADRRHKKGDPSKVDVVAEGAEPRISLAPASPDASADAARASSYGPAFLEIATQQGRSAMPAVDLALLLGPAKKDEGGADWLVATVKKAGPAKEQLGQLPPGLEKDIASLEGTQMKIEVTPDGRETDADTTLGKSAHAELARLARSATEALAIAIVPLPEKPLGVGAQWIAETRVAWWGVDVISYRAYRIKSVDGDKVHLTLDLKAYAASNEPALAGVPKGATLEQYVGEAQGELVLAKGESLPRRFDGQERILMVFQAPGGAPNQADPDPAHPGDPQRNMLTAQIQGAAMLVRGDELRASAKP